MNESKYSDLDFNVILYNKNLGYSFDWCSQPI